jgi:hypothetical protein
MDSFTRLLIVILVLTVPALGYLILRPNAPAEAPKVEQTKEFAEFIETRPKMAEVQRPAPDESNLFGGLKATALPTEVLERLQAYELKWNEVKTSRGETYRREIEDLFQVAQQYENPFAMDLLKQQMIEVRTDPDPETRARSKVWVEKYLKLEPRDFAQEEVRRVYQE